MRKVIVSLFVLAALCVGFAGLSNAAEEKKPTTTPATASAPAKVMEK